ncbi:hypothetical protein [Proteiniphilum sp.]|uniref:hypothetical protein n=1 Tax=Proteiniphilum sp. TaxID=1926877 RepID=UPI003324EC59
MKLRTIILFLFFYGWLCGCSADDVSNNGNEPINEDIVSVIRHGIKNDGTSIGPELNDLVRSSYKKTLYFPAGVYNLTEPIVLPLDYSKNVNIVFDKNALIKCDSHLEALLKIGYSEKYIVDPSLRQFSYIEGGIFDCYNADNGIMVNGLKQLVQLRSISLIKGRKTHIRISVTDDFYGTGSSDTKIDNVTIHGMSSNDDVIGIYIDHSCHDEKISDTFIYGTKQAIVTKSAGHILNNVHILSYGITGGSDLGAADNYRNTEGIRIECGGFFVFNQIYYDTVDKGIVITENNAPTLMLDQNISFSYLDNFGTSFIYRDKKITSTYPRVKLSNSIFTLRNKNYTIFDFNVPIIGWDVDEKYTFVNCEIENPHLLNPYDPSLLQRVRKTTSDAIIYTDLSGFDSEWHVLGAIITSPYRSLLKIDLRDDFTVDLDLRFSGDHLKMNDHTIVNPQNEEFEIGYVVMDDYCVLLFKPKNELDLYPIISDKLGSGSYMPTPSKGQHYRLKDYNISEEPIVVIKVD